MESYSKLPYFAGHWSEINLLYMYIFFWRKIFHYLLLLRKVCRYCWKTILTFLNFQYKYVFLIFLFCGRDPPIFQFDNCIYLKFVYCNLLSKAIFLPIDSRQFKQFLFFVTSALVVKSFCFSSRISYTFLSLH